MQNKLTLAAIRRLKPGVHADGNRLFLKVGANSKSWLFRYTINGRKRDYGLGPFPTVGLVEARAQRDELAALVQAGVDPHEQKQKALGKTFGEMTELCFEAMKGDLKADGEAGRWMSPLKTHVLPALGGRDVTTIDQLVIADLLRPIWKTKVSAAEKSLQRIGIILRFCEAAGIDVDVRATAKAKALLGSQGHAVEHIPSMPWAEVPAFYATLGDTSGERALKLLILTAVRSTPVRYAHGDQIDGDTWTIPPEHMKGRRGKTADFRVPLTEAAQELVRPGLLFPNPKRRPLSDMALSSIMKKRGLTARPHGFRASFRTWAEEHEIDFVVSEMCLAHSVGSSASLAYRRSDLLERRRKVMQAWGDHVLGETTSADIIPMHG